MKTNKALIRITCLSLLLSVPLLQNFAAGQSVVWSTTTPTLGADDISYLTRNTSDALNVANGVGTGAGNNTNTYVAFNQAQVKGQTFTTGANSLGYLLNSVTLSTYNVVSGSNIRFDNGAVFTVRISSVSGTTLTVLDTVQYTLSAADTSRPSGSVGANLASGSLPGYWMTFNLGTPFSLSANTLYAFDWAATTGAAVNNPSATTGIAYWETAGTLADGYVGGTAYMSGSGGFGDTTLLSNTGDRSFAVALTAVPEPSTYALAGLGLLAAVVFRRRN